MECGTRYLLSNGEEHRDGENSDRQRWMLMRTLPVMKMTVVVERVRIFTVMMIRMTITITAMVVMP